MKRKAMTVLLLSCCIFLMVHPSTTAQDFFRDLKEFGESVTDAVTRNGGLLETLKKLWPRIRSTLSDLRSGNLPGVTTVEGRRSIELLQLPISGIDGSQITAILHQVVDLSVNMSEGNNWLRDYGLPDSLFISRSTLYLDISGIDSILSRIKGAPALEGLSSDSTDALQAQERTIPEDHSAQANSGSKFSNSSSRAGEAENHVPFSDQEQNIVQAEDQAATIIQMLGGSNRVVIDAGRLDGVSAGITGRAYYIDQDVQGEVYIAILRVVLVEDRTCVAMVERQIEDVRLGLRIDWTDPLQPPLQQNAAEWFTEGMAALEAGKYEKAIEYFENALQVDPGARDTIEPMIDEAVLAIRQREEEVKRQLQADAEARRQAAEREAELERLPLYRAAATAHMKAERWAEACELWEKILAVDPENSQARREKARAEDELKPAEELIVELPGGVELELVLIPAGSFRMGSPPTEVGRNSDEGPVHDVTISKPFYIGRYEVTHPQYDALMGNRRHQYKDRNNPAVYVGWNNAVFYCEKLSELTGHRYRLPTEAEWEYAARAGTQTRFYWGDSADERVVKRFAWYEKNADKVKWSRPHASIEGTQPVGTKYPNGWRLFDMSGNVYEWCSDRYETEYYKTSPAVDPEGPSSGSYRVLRGGSWDHNSNRLRSADRYGALPGHFILDVGFRIVRDVDE